MKIPVNIGEMKISNKKGDCLVIYGIGSCLGLAVYEPVLKLGGLIHCQLPLSSIDQEKAKKNPLLFVDTGIPILLNRILSSGGDKKKLIVKIAGCARIAQKNNDKDIFNIGEKNYIIARRLLWKNDIFIAAEDVGGNFYRTLYFDIGTGLLYVETNSKRKIL